MKIRCSILVLNFCLALSAPAAAKQSGSAIAAVVNDAAISQYDVDKRLRFVVATTNLAETPDVISRVKPQVLRALINEKLQLQEAKIHGIEIGDDEVKKAMASIEQERGMQPGAIFTMMDKKLVPHDTFTEQLRAQISWGKLLSKVVRPRVRLSEEEIALAQKNYVAPIAISEMQIGIFALPVDKRSRETEIKKFADKMVSESRRGANFEELARQFAGGSGRIEKFWVRPENLDPSIVKVLANARTGTISDPLRNNEGYTIIKVYEVRARQDDSAEGKAGSAQVKIKEFLFKLKPDATTVEAEALVTISREIAKNPGKCEDTELAVGNLGDFDTQINFINSPISDLPPAIRAIIGPMRVGAMSEPFASAEGIRTYMLCERGPPKTEMASRDKVYPMLMQQRMEKEAQKYMRNLTRSAFIDIRDAAPAK
ncbi:MAG: hypothetical protein EBR02_02645 [Alphaproteobacteria bacterium]|nr:hypothetical protein [Alphaproteobacteria bacterium]